MKELADIARAFDAAQKEGKQTALATVVLVARPAHGGKRCTEQRVWPVTHAFGRPMHPRASVGIDARVVAELVALACRRRLSPQLRLALLQQVPSLVARIEQGYLLQQCIHPPSCRHAPSGSRKLALD